MKTFAGRLPGSGTARDAVAIARGAIRSVGGHELVTRALNDKALSRRLDSADRVFCIALGKVADPMFDAVAQAAGANWRGGIVVSGESTARRPGRIRLTGAHPVPDLRSRRAAEAIRNYLAEAELRPPDLVVVCVSGGTSSMVCLPVAPLTLADVRILTRRLLASGLDVTTINRVRRVISGLHGGGLAGLVAPARCLGLILSDNVQVGTPAVGSGPTFPLGVHPAEVMAVIDHLVLPADLRRRVKRAVQGRFSATSPWPKSVTNVVVGQPLDALVAAQDHARKLGYRCLVVSSTVQGEAREVAKLLGAIISHQAAAGDRVSVLAAGEVVVTMNGRGRGRGGRCQELAWAMAPELVGVRGSAFAALATDGRDHIKGVGGAWVTGTTVSQIANAGLEWSQRLEAHDTYGALAQVGKLLAGGPTGTNLCDLYVACLDSRGRQ
jgi:glycerate-2-kinase